jgi:hypothetical protein
MITSRRSFITDLIAFAATAPAIVRASNLMPVKNVDWRELARACTIETNVPPGAVYFQNRLFFINVDQPHVIKYSNCIDPHWNTNR